MRVSGLSSVAAILLTFGAAMAQEQAIFHSGTRLVEVDVVVRDQPVREPGVKSWFAWTFDSGPPFGPPGDMRKGLTKEDFTLLDQGKRQQIAVFRAGTATAGLSGDTQTAILPPEFDPNRAVSNRQDSRGQPLNGATLILIDFLNTDFGCLAYERIGMTKLLHSLGETDDRVALYSLGENLHVLHDFTDDPKRLKEIAAKLDEPGGKLPADIASAIKDYGDLLDLGRAEVHGQMTLKALKLIIQHLSGVTGRKSLIWLMHHPRNVPPAVMAMAQQANIVLYPVLVRATGGELCEGTPLAAADDLAAVTGARAFYDSLDLPFAIRSVEEDTTTKYTLGYYPAEDTLDGKYHMITVKLFNKAPDKQPLEVHYRPGYLATKAAIPPPPPTPEELFEGRLNSARIGLTAQATPEAEHPGRYDLTVLVDLHDIHLERKETRFVGAFTFSIPKPDSKGTVYTSTVSVDLTDKELAAALENGFRVGVSGAEPEAGEFRVVVRDRATGIAGSLRVPVEKQ